MESATNSTYLRISLILCNVKRFLKDWLIFVNSYHFFDEIAGKP